MDLHGAPGSQNGFDNSGKRGDIHFQDGDKPERAARVLKQMSELMKTWIDQGVMRAETLAGIEFLNEPFGWFDPVWQVCRNEFYYNAYDQIRSVFPSENVPIALQTGFRDFSEYDNYMQPPVRYFNIAEELILIHATFPGICWNYPGPSRISVFWRILERFSGIANWLDYTFNDCLRIRSKS